MQLLNGHSHAHHDAFHRGLHRLEDVGAMEGGDGGEHLRVGTFADVVDDVGIEFLYRHAGHGGAEGIDRHHGVGHLTPDDFQGLAQTLHLGLLVARLTAGPGAAATHVDYLSALVDDLVGTARDGLLVLHAALCIEGIGHTV